MPVFWGHQQQTKNYLQQSELSIVSASSFNMPLSSSMNKEKYVCNKAKFLLEAPFFIIIVTYLKQIYISQMAKEYFAA